MTNAPYPREGNAKGPVCRRGEKKIGKEKLGQLLLACIKGLITRDERDGELEIEDQELKVLWTKDSHHVRTRVII